MRIKENRGGIEGRREKAERRGGKEEGNFCREEEKGRSRKWMVRGADARGRGG